VYVKYHWIKPSTDLSAHFPASLSACYRFPQKQQATLVTLLRRLPLRHHTSSSRQHWFIARRTSTVSLYAFIIRRYACRIEEPRGIQQAVAPMDEPGHDELR